MTQEEIDIVIQNAKKQGIDLAQIAIFYGDNSTVPPGLGSFSPDGIPLASDGTRLSPDQITGFHNLAAD